MRVLTTVMELAGLAAIVAAVYMAFGTAAAWGVGGVVLVVYALALERVTR